MCRLRLEKRAQRYVADEYFIRSSVMRREKLKPEEEARCPEVNQVMWTHGGTLSQRKVALTRFPL